MDTTSPQSEVLIDKIGYLASLVSDPRAIDPTLDRLRQITVTHTRGSALSDDKIAILQGVYQEIEQYLTTQDPQRVFTPDELHQKIVERFELQGRTTQLRKKIWGIGTLAAILGSLSMLVPVPSTQDSAFEFYLRLSIPTIFTILHFGAAWLFVSALRYFRANLKTAYRLIAAGIVMLGLAQAQLVVLGLLDLWSDPWTTIGIISIIFSIAFCLVFFGVRILSRLFGLHNPATSPAMVVLGMFVACGAVIISPHYPAPVPELYVDIGSSGLAAATVLTAAATMTAITVRRRVSVLYQKPLRALAVALVLMVVGGMQFLVIQLGLGYHNWYEDSGLAYLPLLLAALAFVRAGYFFNKVSTY